LKLANQDELDAAIYNDYQLATEQVRRKVEFIRQHYWRMFDPLPNYPYSEDTLG
jgi:hypothetical protein